MYLKLSTEWHKVLMCHVLLVIKGLSRGWTTDDESDWDEMLEWSQIKKEY